MESQKIMFQTAKQILELVKNTFWYRLSGSKHALDAAGPLMPLCVNRMRSTSTLRWLTMTYPAKDGSEVTCKISSLQIPGLVNIQKAMVKMAIEIVSFPIKNGDFP